MIEMSDEQRSYYYKHREEGHPEYGPALRCPSCGGTEFFIYRGKLFTDQERKTIEPIADCKNCCRDPTVSMGTGTYVFALKTNYHDDKAKDFKITRKAKITY